MKKILNWKLALILIIILAALLRLWQLGNIPAGIPDDEAAYIYNAYSIWQTGKDVSGKFLPLSFNTNSSQSPVEVYLTAPFVGLLGLNTFSARLPSALLGIGSVIVLFFLIDSLFKNKRTALIGAFLLSVSPWALQLQRGLWDADFGLFFMLAGIYVFVANVHTRKFLWSLVPFLLAFYSYHAIKVYFIFLIPVLCFFYRKELLKRKKEIALFLLGVLLILVSFFVVIKTQKVTRQTEITLFNYLQASTQVNWERDKNTAPEMLRIIFSNKPLYYLRTIRENYLKPFSPEYLFISGDLGTPSQIVNIYYRGVLYIIELPLLLLGIYALFKSKNKSSRNLLLALLLISPLPSTFTLDRNFVSRDIMLLPILLTIIALGINYLLERVSSYIKIYRAIFLSTLIAIYLFLIAGYLYQYYYRWPVYGAEAWGTSSKELVEYVAKVKDKYTNVYITNSYRGFLLKYAIFEKIDPRVVQRVWNNDPIKVDNITMFNKCLNDGTPVIADFLPSNTLFISPARDCHYVLSSEIAKIVDKGEITHVIWNIYENK